MDQYDLLFPLYLNCSTSSVLADEDEKMLYRCFYCSPVVLNTVVMCCPLKIPFLLFPHHTDSALLAAWLL